MSLAPLDLVEAFSTVCIRGGFLPDPTTGAVVTPIVQSTTYAQSAVGEHKGFTYSRAANPTVEALERGLAALESSPNTTDFQSKVGGTEAVAFATGMAAISTLFLSVLKAGDHAVVSEVVYGGTVRLVRQVLEGLGVSVSFADTGDIEAVRRAITDRTRLVFIETPGNPTLRLADVAAIARVTRAAGVLLAVDNTFLTPVILRPLDLGADVAVYSTTKYIEGHNSTVGGSITTRDGALADRLRLFRKTLGCIQSPFDAWLTLRGLKTLPLRISRHCESAKKVAEWLANDPRIERVFYPGLATFPQRELAAKQHGGLDGGIVAFEVQGSDRHAAGVSLLNSVRLCTLAENLGATETLITHPVSMTHGDVPREQRERVGITDGLVRLSVGLESPADIIADLDQALEKATGSVQSAATGRQRRKAAGNGQQAAVKEQARIEVTT